MKKITGVILLQFSLLTLWGQTLLIQVEMPGEENEILTPSYVSFLEEGMMDSMFDLGWICFNNRVPVLNPLDKDLQLSRETGSVYLVRIQPTDDSCSFQYSVYRIDSDLLILEDLVAWKSLDSDSEEACYQAGSAIIQKIKDKV